MSNQIPLYLPIPSREEYERYKEWERQQEEQKASPSGIVIVIDLAGDINENNKIHSSSVKKS